MSYFIFLRKITNIQACVYLDFWKETEETVNSGYLPGEVWAGRETAFLLQTLSVGWIYIFKPCVSITWVIKKQLVFKTKRIHLRMDATAYWTVWKCGTCGPKKEVGRGEKTNSRTASVWTLLPPGLSRVVFPEGSAVWTYFQSLLLPLQAASSRHWLPPQKFSLPRSLAETPSGEPLPSHTHLTCQEALRAPSLSIPGPRGPSATRGTHFPFLSFVQNHCISEVNCTWPVFYLLHSFIPFIVDSCNWL